MKISTIRIMLMREIHFLSVRVQRVNDMYIKEKKKTEYLLSQSAHGEDM
jgi:hypothetical protein